MSTALCPGSFDPPTLGHADVIARCLAVFDRVIVGVVRNPSKQAMFSAEERVGLLTELFDESDRFEVLAFDGLLVDFAGQQGVDVIVKGLRAVADFEYEQQMAQMNQRLSGIDTMFMATTPEFGYLSSSLVKEVAKLGGEVKDMLPANVYHALKERI